MDEEQDLRFFCDNARHLVCVPYSIENLHKMARRLGIARNWFHNSKSGAHYDIPKKRVDDIRRQCKIVTTRQILEIINGTFENFNEASKKEINGIIYLIHFDEKIGNPKNPRAQAQHYIGWSRRLDARLRYHGAGSGAAITNFCTSKNIGMEVVRAWHGTKDDERSVKNMKIGPRLCTICSAESGRQPIDIPWLDESDPDELCNALTNEDNVVTFSGRPDARSDLGYARLGEPKFQGRSLQGQPSWPFIDPDEVTVADRTCACGADPCECPSDDKIGPDDEDLLGGITARVLGRIVKTHQGEYPRDGFAFMNGSMKIGEGMSPSSLGGPSGPAYQRDFTMRPRSAKNVPGALDGWVGRRPTHDDPAEDHEPIIDLIDLLDPDDDWRPKKKKIR